MLPAVNTAVAKTIVASSESHAVAPAATATSTSSCTDSDHDCGKGPGLTSNCIGYPSDTVDKDGDCDTGYKSVSGKHKHKASQKCTDADHDCGKGPSLTSTCVGFTNDTFDHDGDCDTGQVSGASKTAAEHVVSAQTLPFTGQDVLKVVLVGLLLAAGGIALGLRTRKT